MLIEITQRRRASKVVRRNQGVNCIGGEERRGKEMRSEWRAEGFLALGWNITNRQRGEEQRRLGDFTRKGCGRGNNTSRVCGKFSRRPVAIFVFSIRNPAQLRGAAV